MEIEVTYLWVTADGKFIPKETIAELFCTYGGGFVRSLGEALRHADPFNTSDILQTFERYVKYYLTDFYDIKKGQIKKVKEKVVASAVKYGSTIVAGKRHGDAIFLAHQLYGIKKGVSFEQWYVTNYGRYLPRAEALELVKKNGQLKKKKIEVLFSEDLR